jgi:hypothetical protein
MGGKGRIMLISDTANLDLTLLTSMNVGNHGSNVSSTVRALSTGRVLDGFDCKVVEIADQSARCPQIQPLTHITHGTSKSARGSTWSFPR